MKPRVFIGSSVEGLTVAYAVQQNLLHDAEVTVWDQGIFELSATTIESMVKALESNDFGVFVFSADDIVKMRIAESPSVRDNVIFEFGLFIGRLGRSRVFFLLPSETEIHIPSDLLGITPGKYDTNRSDGSMQAATGPACHQIRLQIKNLGSLESREVLSSTSEEIVSPKGQEPSWVQDFIEKKYESAIETLKNSTANHTGDKAIEQQIWIKYCEFKKDDKLDSEFLSDFARAQTSGPTAFTTTALILRMEKYEEQAISLLQEAKNKWPKDISVDVCLAQTYVAAQKPELAIELLQSDFCLKSLEAVLTLASIFEDLDKKPEAITAIRDLYSVNPRSSELRYRYARLAQELGLNTIALFLLDELAREYPDSIEYWGYLGNSCLDLKMNDMALVAYRKAEALIKPGQGSQWIISNIGNLFSNLSLHAEASKYLEQSSLDDPTSEYAHDRLAGAIKGKDENIKEYRKKCKEGSIAIRENTKKASAP